MKKINTNLLIKSICKVCLSHVLTEKWLIAPSLRIGYQWLEQVAKSGQPVLNIHVKTLKRLALDIASPFMNSQDLTFLGSIQAEVLTNSIFSKLDDDNGYLTKSHLSRGLIQTVLRSINDLRLAGMTSDTIQTDSFEVTPKGNDIKYLMRKYEQALEDNKLIDYADILRISKKCIEEYSSVIPKNVLLLIPENSKSELSGLESDFWQAIPEANQNILTEDSLDSEPDGDTTDASMLRFLLDPGKSSEPENDGTANIFRAIGEVNEVRGIIRHCIGNRISFDKVEILYTDSSTYLPLIYELAIQYPTDDEPIPVTFAQGIPIGYSRPGKVLMGLFSWSQDDYKQSILVRMIQDGFLIFDKGDKQSISSKRLASILKTLPIGFGRERYLKTIEDNISALEKYALRLEQNKDKAAKSESKQKINLKNLEGLKLLHNLIQDLFKCLPKSNNDKSILDEYKAFLENRVRCSNQFDEYCRRMLIRKIEELKDCLKSINAEHFNVQEWFHNLIQTAKASGQGPRSGCIYVSPLLNGGNSGREYTFIVGLDDSRFPGAGLQDPLLLDNERNKISSGLSTSAEYLSKSIESFASLLARLRGKVTLSYSCYDLNDDSEKFPSPVLLSAFRIISGKHDGDQTDLTDWLPTPVSFTPAHLDQCINVNEWWLYRLCGDNYISNQREMLSQYFPHLNCGLQALEARESDEFTHYDGYVPDAGKDYDPTKPDGKILSSSQLETLGRCPMEFFFKYVLEIKQPEEYKFDPNSWLDPLNKGSLLHSVFYEFMVDLTKSDKLPNFQEDEENINLILDKYISQYKAKFIPPNRDVFEKEVRELSQAARIFLLEEQDYCQQNIPLFFEVALGLKSTGEGSPIDSDEPIIISISNTKSIKAKGRIDRIDQIPSAGEMLYCIWDYKTGSSYKFEKNTKDPFLEGRCIQNILYILMAKTQLRKSISLEASVVRFGYFFPNHKEHGNRIEWDTGTLIKGKMVLNQLCQMISDGCFPFTDKVDDVKYSDYNIAFGNIQKNTESVITKLENPTNTILSPFMDLRGYEEQNGI